MSAFRTNGVATAPDSSATGTAPLRILVLDRSRLLADVLARRVLAEDDVGAVAVASSAAEGLRLLAEASYDTVVATPDLALEIRAVPPTRVRERARSPIVVLADSGDTARARDVFRVRGIAGWVSRDRSTEDLLKAIRTSQRGDVCLPMEILDQLADNHANDGAEQTARDRVFATLTEREVEVLQLLEQGMGRDEIAAALHLSPNTVRTHIQRILRRLNVHSTLAALALVRV